MLIDIHETDTLGNVFTLMEDIYYKDLTIPCGFQSDGCSVPRIFWRVIFPPLDNKAIRAGVIHDYIYRTHPANWTKGKADREFRKLLLEDGVPSVRANLAFLGVVFGGGKAWKTKGGLHESKDP